MHFGRCHDNSTGRMNVVASLFVHVDRHAALRYVTLRLRPVVVRDSMFVNIDGGGLEPA